MESALELAIRIIIELLKDKRRLDYLSRVEELQQLIGMSPRECIDRMIIEAPVE
jgi:hypothetical protein